MTPLGSVATSTNPVAKVARIAPSVPMPESRPTMVPVRPTSRSWSFTTIGVTPASSAEGKKSAITARMTTSPGALPCRRGPKARTRGTVTAVTRPATTRTRPRVRRGSKTR